MKWWNTVSDATCVFAIDSESTLTKTQVSYTNNNSKKLTALSPTDSLYIGTYAGRESKNFIPSTEIKHYRSLYIKDTNLSFIEPVTLPTEFTIILKCIVYKSTTFLSNNGINNGLMFGLGEYNSVDDFSWKFDGFGTGSDTTKDVRMGRGRYILDTVIVKGNSNTKTVTVNTNYGKFTVPPESTAYSSFFTNQSFSTLGSQNESTKNLWRPDTSIVGFGIFNKNFTDIEIDQILNTMDSQFLIRTSKETSELSTNLFVKKLWNLKSSDFNEAHLYSMKASSAINGELSYRWVEPEYKNLTKERLYSRLKDIEDIVLEEGRPVSTKLFLYERITGFFLKDTVSNLLGEFKFINLNADFEYIVTGTDPKYQFQSVIKNYNLK